MLALWVILHHLSGKGMMLEPWIRSLPPAFGDLVHNGYLAVGTFFVLSGFVLARGYGTTTWNRGSLIRYGVARLARIYPTYLLSILIVSPFIFDWCFPTSRPAPDLSEQAAQLGTYGFVLQGWFAHSPVSWNTPAWSLSCELFFYLCFPLAVTCLGARSWPKLAAVAAAALALPVLLAGIHVPWPWKPIYHIADFLIGIAAAGIYDAMTRSRLTARIRGAWLYAPAALTGTALVAFPVLVPGTFTLGGALRPLNATMLIGLALGGGFPARLLSTRIADYLGRASYSMYILHIPLLWWYKRSWMHRSGLLTENGSALLYLAAVIAASVLVCELIEEPTNKLIRSWITSRSGAAQRTV